jgi:RNA polymerase sigma factor (sigma-70 family)
MTSRSTSAGSSAGSTSAHHPNATVTELVRRASDGDQQAWNEIVDRFTNLLWSIGRAHRLDTADISDVIQTTWLRLLENLDRINDPESLPGWLSTTARRECLRVVRRSGKESTAWDDELVADIVDTTTEPIDTLLLVEERDAVLWRCFTKLSERCQRMLRILMAGDAPGYAQIARGLDIPIGSIGPTRMRCLQSLRQHTAASGYPFATTEGQ